MSTEQSINMKQNLTHRNILLAVTMSPYDGQVTRIVNERFLLIMWHLLLNL